MARNSSRDGVLDARRIHGVWQKRPEQGRYGNGSRIEWRGRADGHGGGCGGTDQRRRDGSRDNTRIDCRSDQLDEDHRW
jgi:hypothetical protein